MLRNKLKAGPSGAYSVPQKRLPPRGGRTRAKLNIPPWLYTIEPRAKRLSKQPPATVAIRTTDKDEGPAVMCTAATIIASASAKAIAHHTGNIPPSAIKNKSSWRKRPLLLVGRRRDIPRREGTRAHAATSNRAETKRERKELPVEGGREDPAAQVLIGLTPPDISYAGWPCIAASPASPRLSTQPYVVVNIARCCINPTTHMITKPNANTIR